MSLRNKYWCCRMIAKLSKGFPFVWGLTLLGGTCSTLTLCPFEASPPLLLPLTHFNQCSISLTTNSAECWVQKMSELQISNVSAYQRRKSFHPVTYNTVVFWPLSSLSGWAGTGDPLPTARPLLSPQHRLCSNPAVSWAPDHSFLHRWPAFMGRTGGSMPPLRATRRSRQSHGKQEEVFMLPRKRRELNLCASGGRQAALHHPALVVPSTGAVPGTFLFKEKKPSARGCRHCQC